MPSACGRTRWSVAGHRRSARCRQDVRHGTRALAQVDLDVRRGEFLTLVGPSGCGKIDAAEPDRRACPAQRPAAVRWWGADFAHTGGTGRQIGFVFQSPTLMPWARVDDERAAAARPRGRAARDADAARRESAGARPPPPFARPPAAATLRRHADARVDRPRARHRARPAADGRAVRRARRIHAAAPRQRAARPVVRATNDDRVRHAQHPGGRVPVESRGGDGRAPGTHARMRGRSTRPIRASDAFRLSRAFAEHAERLSACVAEAGADALPDGVAQ